MSEVAERPSPTVPTVHLLCGLPGSGKSTLARRLADTRPAVRFTLDEWMLRMHGLHFEDPDYASKATDCRELIWEIACQVLATGSDVVLDWSQWSRAKRAEWAERARSGGFRVVVHDVVVDPEVAIAQAAGREGLYTHQIGAAGVRRMVDLVEPPEPDEGIEIIKHDRRSSRS